MNDATTNAPTKRFTLEEATAMLPLVRSIVSDICEVFRTVTVRRVELHRLLRTGNRGRRDRGAGQIYDDEMAESRADLSAEYDQIWKFREELESLGVILRMPEEGLIEFPSIIDGQPAFYSWRLGEVAVSHFRMAADTGSTRLPIKPAQE